MCSNCFSSNSVQNPNQGYPIGCCKFKEGYYCIWNLDHETMVCEEWAELCDLRSVLHTISHITFNVVAERNRARTALMNLKRDAPFGECKRFPWRKTMVNISCSGYSSLLQDVLSSLDFKDRETEKEMRYGNNHKQDDKDQNNAASSSMDDAKTRFRSTLVKFQNALCKKDEVYDRIKFERKYELSWCEGPCPGEPVLGDPDNPTIPIPIPTPPVSRTYGDMMRILRLKGLEPRDFNVFTEIDMKYNDFDCGRETQTLGPGLEKNKLPLGTKRVFLFSRGEYSQCLDEDAEVQGYIYDLENGSLAGPSDLKRFKGGRIRKLEESINSILEQIGSLKLSRGKWIEFQNVLEKLASDDESIEEIGSEDVSKIV